MLTPDFENLVFPVAKPGGTPVVKAIVFLDGDGGALGFTFESIVPGSIEAATAAHKLGQLHSARLMDMRVAGDKENP